MYQPEAPQVSSSSGDGVCVITLVGDFDLATIAPFRDAVQAALDDDCAIILDMSDTTFVDSTALGVITAGRVGCERRGHQLGIVAPRSNVRRVLQLMALDTVIPIYPTLHDALPGASAAAQPA